MLKNLQNHNVETLEHRLAKRRQIWKRNLEKKNSNHSPEEQLVNGELIRTHSVDRTTTTPTNKISESKATLTIETKNVQLPFIDSSYVKQEKKLSIHTKINSTSQSLPLKSNQAIDFGSDRQQIQSNDNGKYVIVKQNLGNEKSVQIDEDNKVKLVPLFAPHAIEKNDSIETNVRHVFTYPKSSPQHTSHYSKIILRSKSESVLSKNKSKHRPIDSMYLKHNSLVLPYLFNRAIIDAELSRMTISKREQSNKKTIWD